MHLFLGTNVNRLTFMELCVLCNPVLISEQGKVEIKKGPCVYFKSWCSDIRTIKVENVYGKKGGIKIGKFSLTKIYKN